MRTSELMRVKHVEWLLGHTKQLASAGHDHESIILFYARSWGMCHGCVNRSPQGKQVRASENVLTTFGTLLQI